MVTQTPINGCEPEPSAAEGVSRNLGDFVGDVMSLGELQAQLLSIDAREAVSKAKVPALCGLGAIVLALGAVPMLLVAVAMALIHRANLAPDVAYLVSFLLGAVIAGGLAWVSWNRLGEAAPIIMRSKGELTQNLRWIKHALQKNRQPRSQQYRTGGEPRSFP